MQRFLSDTVKNIKGSALVSLQDKSMKLKAEGRDILSFSGGEPDFITPMAVRDCAEQAMNAGQTHYVSAAGLPAFRQAIAQKLHRDNGLDVDWNSQILVTVGGKQALEIAMSAVIAPGDEVILFEPAWVSYRQLIALHGGTVVPVALEQKENFAITREKLEPCISPKTKLLIINSPNNPTGRVITREEAELIADLAVEHDFLILSDEIYEKILYDGREHITMAAIERIRDRVITVNGMSKGYAMTGWRLGYLTAHPDLTAAMLKIVQNTYTCAPAFLQQAAVEAFSCEDEVAVMTEEYRRRRDFIVSALNGMKGVTCPMPEGAFYIFARVEKDGMDSWQIADYILEQTGVVVAPGDAFGLGGGGCIRMSYASSMEMLEEAAARMTALFGKKEEGC